MAKLQRFKKIQLFFHSKVLLMLYLMRHLFSKQNIKYFLSANLCVWAHKNPWQCFTWKESDPEVLLRWGTNFEITKFKITKFEITKFEITKFEITKFEIQKFKITKFKITKFKINFELNYWLQGLK